MRVPEPDPTPLDDSPLDGTLLAGTLLDDVRALVAAFAEEHHCPTISWGIARDGALIAHGATGTLHHGAQPSTQTVYRIASMTKSFTSALVLGLRDEGVLRLDDPISTHAPELAAITGPTCDAPPLTLGHLLSMATGLATDDVWADRHLDITDDELDEVIATGGHFAVDPGTAFEYSNLGFALVGRIVLRATGRRVQDLVRERLIEPLGLTRTTWVQPTHDDWAQPFGWEDDVHVPEMLVADGVLAPMGGIWSCIDDLVIWSRWFEDAFRARNGDDTGPLRRSSRREMQQIHSYGGTRTIAGRPAPNGYGYGLLMRDDAELGPLAGHSGGLPGYGSNMRWTPGRGLSVVALANVTYAHMAELTLRIFDALHAAGQVPAVQVSVHPQLESLVHRLVALIHDWDDAVADELFTDNVAWDEPYERRRRAATEAIGDAGPVTLSRIDAATAARADAVLLDADGAELTLELELAPLVPLRIQSFSLER